MTPPADAPLAPFLADLFAEGRAVLRGPHHLQPASHQALAECGPLVEAFHKHAAREAPGVAPPLNLDAALWAAEAFAWGCGMLVDRGQTETGLPGWLIERQPAGINAGEHWSVDLVFRFLADLIKRSAHIAKQDPFHRELSKLAERWPLSAVGTEVENEPSAVEHILGDACLTQMYLDRIITRKDRRRAADPRVTTRLACIMGAYPFLAD